MAYVQLIEKRIARRTAFLVSNKHIQFVCELENDSKYSHRAREHLPDTIDEKQPDSKNRFTCICNIRRHVVRVSMTRYYAHNEKKQVENGNF